MENNLKYSIIYANIRPEIAEKLSLGILIIENEKVNVLYSQKKLNVLKMLYTPKEYGVVSRMVRQELRKLNPQTLTYLTRYSNNLIAFSQIQNIDNTQSNINSSWLYKNYVYNS